MKRDANTPTHGRRFREAVKAKSERDRKYARKTRIAAGWFLFSTLTTYGAIAFVASFLWAASSNRHHDDPFIYAFAIVAAWLAVVCLVPTVIFAAFNIRYLINPFRKPSNERLREHRTRNHDASE